MGFCMNVYQKFSKLILKLNYSFLWFLAQKNLNFVSVKSWRNHQTPSDNRNALVSGADFCWLTIGTTQILWHIFGKFPPPLSSSLSINYYVLWCHITSKYPSRRWWEVSLAAHNINLAILDEMGGGTIWCDVMWRGDRTLVCLPAVVWWPCPVLC